METALLTPLNALEASLNTLISSLTTTNTFSNAPVAAKGLVSADDALTSALTTLKQHQDNYARILILRAEAARLQDQIKSIVRTCVDFRAELGSIHASILDDSDSEDDDEVEDEDDSSSKTREVDYETLLSFAARIGKHNAAAAREAEQDSLRRRLEARKPVEEQGHITNGAMVQSPVGSGHGDLETSNATQEARAELAAVGDAVTAQRAAIGMGFPPAERLRMGALGQLQLVREQSGEDAVEREIERMIRESEDVAAQFPRAEQEPARPDAVTLRGSSGTEPKPPHRPSESGTRPEAPRPGPARRKLELDFPGSDDEDEDG